MKAKKIAALGLSLMMTMSLCGDVLAADIPVQEETAVVSVEDIAGETEDEEITFAESTDEGTGENVGDAETDVEIALESEDGEEESVEDAFSSEENTAALEDEDIAAYRELDESDADDIFSWYETEDGTVTIGAYCGKESVVTIPSELGGHVVTTLDGIFNNSAGSPVMEVIIPDSVQTIEKSFMNCPNLTKITLGSGVTSIDKYTFWDCPKLKTVIVSDKNTTYSAENGILYNKAKTEIKYVCEGISGNIKISDKVEEIKDCQFWERSGMTGITLPNGLKRIGRDAFYYCTGLTSVVIPDSVQEIDMWAFKGCYGIRSVSLGRGVKYLHDSFTDSKVLKSIVIPPEVKGMEHYAVGYYYDSDANEMVQVRDFVIYGEKGSAAEKYAKEYGFTFVSKSFSDGTSSETQNYNTITASNKTMTVSASKARTWAINAKAKGGAKLSYKSSNAKVKVSSTGKVTIPKKFTGTVKITITASATKAYAKTSKVVTLTVKKAANPMKVTTKNQKIKASAIKKKAKTFTIKVTKAQGKVTYKSSASKYIKVAKNGKVTIRKRTPKGKYKITVTAAGKGIYGKKSKVITIIVK
nr:leucine-rich repeat protein [uncultured Blautia sp.]